MTPRVREILSWYGSETPGTLANMARMMNHGKLAGSGKLVILPVDQGFEHGPARSFAKNPAGYNPHYHFELAIESGCSAYAAPLGFIEAGAREYAGEIPLILKVNNSETLFGMKGPISAVTSSIDHALRLGCAGIGFTIYPGSSARKEMYEELAILTEEAKKAGLAVVVWSYARGEDLSKDGETAVDVISYAAQIAAQLGANIIKVKPPTSFIEQAAAKKVYDSEAIKIDTLEDRISHVIQSSFAGRRIVIFSGGATKGTDELMKEIQALAKGGSFGSIMGRNAFQRPKEEALKLLSDTMDIYLGKN
ncbi:MAG: class I fructose-bisphosphate aldolase [Bdellovibrionales bacterium]